MNFTIFCFHFPAGNARFGLRNQYTTISFVRSARLGLLYRFEGSNDHNIVCYLFSANEL